MKKDKLRLSRAFTEAPSQLDDAVEAAFRRGEQAMKKRHKLTIALTAAAACVVILAGLALAAGRLTAPRPDPVVAAQNEKAVATAKPTADIMTEITPMPTPEITPEPTPTPEITPEPTPEPTPTPEITPEPTPGPTPEPEVNLVYTQPKGNYYHSDPNCSDMVGAVPWTEESAISVGKQPCPVCILGTATMEEVPEEAASAEAVEAPLYYTEGGRYYHGDAHCSGIQNAQPHSVELALASGKQRCPVCQPVEPDHYDLFLEAFGQGLEALVPGCVYGYCGHDTDFFGDDGWFVTDGEAYSVACHVSSFLRADGVEQSIYSDLDTPLEDVLCISFDARNLDNLWPFLSETEAGKIAFDKKDKAVSHMFELAHENDEAIAMPSSLEEDNIWVAIGSDGTIRELEVCYIDASGEYTATIGWRLDDSEYVLTGGIEPPDHKRILN